MKNEFIKKLVTKILSVVYPEHVTCIFCNNEAILDSMGICKKCAKSIVSVETCAGTLRNIPELDGMTAVFRYSGSVADAVKRFKYKNGTYLGKEFARFMYVDESWNIDLVVPVPIHKKRERARGYNQCQLLAEPLCERLGLELDTNVMQRIINTNKQANKGVNERKTNLYGAFCADTEKCVGKNILLIDDVCTTGSTLRECAKTLKKSGANKVYAAVFCHSRDCS